MLARRDVGGTLRRLQRRAGGVLVERERPELFDRGVRRHAQAVRLGAVQPRTRLVARGLEVDLAEADDTTLHTGGVADRLVEPGGALVELREHRQLLVELDHVGVFPVRALEHRGAGEALVEGVGAGHQLAGECRVAEDLPAACVGLEGLARLHAERAHHGVEVAVVRLHRFAVEDIFELLEVADVARLPRRPVTPADRDEVRHARRRALVPAVDTMLAQRRLGLDRVRRETARTEPDLVGLGARDEVARRVQVFTARRQDQVLAALPLVGTGLAHVDDGPLPDVIHATGGRARGHFDHERTLRREVPEGEGVDRGEVRRQHARLVLEGLVHHDLAVARTEVFALRFAQAVEADRGQPPEEGLRRTLEVHLVVELLDRLFGGIAVLELQGAEAGVHLLGVSRRGAKPDER